MIMVNIRYFGETRSGLLIFEFVNLKKCLNWTDLKCNYFLFQFKTVRAGVVDFVMLKFIIFFKNVRIYEYTRQMIFTFI